MTYLHDRLIQQHGPSHLLLTGPAHVLKSAPAHALTDAKPAETQSGTQAFLDHWSPDVSLWSSGYLQPLLISETRARRIPLLFLGATVEHMDQNIWRWVPRLARDTLADFDLITAASPEAARFLSKLSNGQARIAHEAPLQISAPVQGVNEAQFADLSDMLAGRAVWLAARVQEDEISDILKAHTASLRLAHRLLLVMVCASFPVAMKARESFAKSGWRCAYWDDGDIIDEATQIVLIEDADTLGLWFRAAPVSFLASSLKPGHGGCDPYEAAALGSAIIYGPNVRNHLASYTRLASVGAARIVSDADGLARALSHLIAVDQAAAMAHAAWQVISSGADVTDAVTDHIQTCLDDREGAV